MIFVRKAKEVAPRGAVSTRQPNRPKERLLINWRPFASFFLGASVLVALVWGAVLLVRLLDHPLQQVEIRGELTHLQVAPLIEQVQARVDAGMVGLDLADVQQLLLAEPWVEQATVRRKWPDILQIDLVERKPVVRWYPDSLMTEAGLIFSPQAAQEQSALPLLKGPKASRKNMLSRLRWLSAELAEVGLTVSDLRKEPRGSWNVGIENSFRIELGSGDIKAKIKRFKGLYQHSLHARVAEIESVDLRYTHGAAVRWRTGQTSSRAGTQPFTA